MTTTAAKDGEVPRSRKKRSSIEVAWDEFYVRDKFHRVVEKDETIYFGDGGKADLFYPIYMCPKMKFPETEGLLKKLTAEMARVASTRNDMQQNGVVEDIVDPELYPQFIPEHKRLNKKQDFEAHEDEPRAYREGTTERVILFDETKKRSTYSWIPTLVSWNKKTLRSHICGPIQNLPRTESNRNLYQYLEEVLTEFMPTLMNEDCKARKKISSSTAYEDFYNICIKLQRYHIPPGSEYKGQWHTEGVNEEVSAVGVLYTDWPEGLLGGALKFRPATVPNESYRDMIYNHSGPGKPTYGVELHATEGTALAFNNSVPHRFMGLYNDSEETITRSFVNFFVVDPWLKNTNEVPTNADIYLALIGALNYDVVGDILEFLQITPPTEKAALTLRKLAKAEMVATKGKWGNINYGNCGQLSFLPCGGPSEPEWKIRTQWTEKTKELAEYDWRYYYSEEFLQRVLRSVPKGAQNRHVVFMKYGVNNWNEMRKAKSVTASSSSGDTLPE